MNRFFKPLWLLLAVLCFCVYAAVASPFGVSAMENGASGLVTMPSQFSVQQTGDRFERILQDRGLTLFARIDHAQNAASVDQRLRETQLFIFGNPNVGTPLMQCSQTVAIDLPQKALIWQDETDRVWFAFNDPQYLMTRHDLTGCEPNLERIGQVLHGLAIAATQDG